jgi:gliding motility-associated-like protein
MCHNDYNGNLTNQQEAPVAGTITQPNCTSATGSVTLNGLPSTGLWSLKQTPEGIIIVGSGTTTIISGLTSATTYTFTVTNAEGCVSPASSLVVINPQPSTPATPSQTIDCSLGFGNATATVTSPTGAGIEYSLDGGTYQAGTTFTGIANGSHSITVRNASGCITTGSSFSVSCGCINGPTLTLSSVSGNTCGIAPVTVTGNTYANATSVSITANGAGSVSPVSSVTSPFAFTYTPVVSDIGKTVIITVTTDNPLESPCTAAVATYTLTVNVVPVVPSVTSLIQPTCAVPTGSVILNGLPAGNWTINPGAIAGSTSSTTISGLAIGTYNFTVTSEAGCISAASTDVTFVPVPGAPAAPTVTVTDPTCDIPTGTITVTSVTAGLTFSLDGTAFAAYPAGGFTSVAAGPHTLTAQNADNCLSPVTNVTVIGQPTIKNNYTKELSDYNGFNISCYGQSDGFIRITTSGESTPFTFSWSGPGGFTASTKDILGLVAGQYILVITAENMCTATETIMLTEPEKLGMIINTSISNDGAYNINCGGEKTGFITVLAKNYAGTAGYLWENGSTENTRTNLSAGSYKIVITDSNNCQADSTVTLTEPDPLKLSTEQTEPFCPDKPDGEIRVTVSGGFPGDHYTYLWSDNSTGENKSNIPAGLYKVTVTDLNGCSVKDSIDLKSQNESCLIIPEAFSPNGDGINDFWNIGNIYLYPDVEIIIYNRWGESVWKSERGYPHPWDGRSNGVNLPIDSYHYIIKLHNGSKPIIGDITIIR